MGKYKTVNTGGLLVSTRGKLRFLSEVDGLRQPVEVWLLNDKINRNDLRYERLEEHMKLFGGTPLLVAYVGNKIGDGHNFKEIKNPDGSISADFRDATAERIVGYFPTAEDIRMETRGGEKWIVGKGYIWTWYAQELVRKLKQQGLDGMDVSIETLVEEMHMEGSTDVYTRWKVLGTTLLGDDVNPAVENAFIRALSEAGDEEVRNITLRVASANTTQSTASNESTKKEKQPMVKIKDLEGKFPQYKVLSTDGVNVALLGDNGDFCLCSVEKQGDEVIIGKKLEAVCNMTLVNGDVSVTVPGDVLVENSASRIAELNAELATAKERCEAAELALASMQKAEKARRADVVRKTITDRMAEICANCESVASNKCDDLKTDEKVEDYVCMEDKDGKWCGAEQAEKDVDARCMNDILSANKLRVQSEKKQYAWETIGKNQRMESPDQISQLVEKYENK